MSGADLSGGWTGSYVYPGSLAPVPFTLELSDHGGRLAGIVTEPAPPYMGGGEVQAVVTGSHDGAAVRFTKVYDALEHFLAPVLYAGTIDDDGCEVSGEWRIEGEWSGGFVMTRPRPERAADEIEVEAEV